MSVITSNLPTRPGSPPTSTTIASTQPASTTVPSAVTGAAAITNPEPVAMGLFDLRPSVEAPENELLRNRFLSRKGSMLIVGNTGIGKSSLVMQMMIQWALGVGCFGINPARPLKSLLVQGENDEQDLAEMRDGVVGSLQLTDDQKALINANVVVCHEAERHSEEFVDEVLERLILSHQPDLVWIDPVFQYLGGDSNQQEVVSSFLRQQLGSLLKRHQCAVVLIHHTNKPARNRNGPANNNPNLRAYDAAGSAEFGNWPRAMLSLQSTTDRSIYKLVAAKRGIRLGWRMADGTTPSFTKLLTHSHQPGVIYWQEAGMVACPANPTNQPPNPSAAQQQPPANANNPNDGLDDADRAILTNIPVNDSVEKKVLIGQVNRLSSIGVRRLRDSIKKLIAVPLLEEFKVPRPGKVKAVHLRRVQRQPQQPQQPALETPTPPPQPPCQPRQQPE